VKVCQAFNRRARGGSVIDALFDGNIHSPSGAFGYDPLLNRSVVVSTGAVEAALGRSIERRRRWQS
jgi:hypothetical protein